MVDLDAVAHSLARNLKRTRQERGYSLDALAARSGVSRGMIIQIEQARTNPSIGTVVRLGDALGVSVANLLDDDAPGSAVRLVAPKEAIELWRGPGGSTAVLQAGIEAPGPLELWAWYLAPGEGHESSSHPAGSAELIRVDEGVLTLVVDGEEHRVPAGTTATFEASAPHGYRNDGDEPVRMTMAVAVPPPR